MLKKIFRFVFSLFLLVVLGGSIYWYRDEWRQFLARTEKRFFPCRRPIGYTIGVFDTQFGISETDFLNAVKTAEETWENSINKDLFAYKTGGNLKINLIYDARQETTEHLQKVDTDLQKDQMTFNELKEKYTILAAEYDKDKAAIDARIAAFKNRQKAYEAEADRWNKQGGAPHDVYEQLGAEKKALQAEAALIEQMVLALNARAKDLSSWTTELNTLVAKLNLSVERYNDKVAERGREFEEGNYQSGSEGQYIDIYEFDTKEKLVRLLAHELGHALGLEHVNDPQAIMYWLNQSATNALTSEDLKELKKQCRLDR